MIRSVAEDTVNGRPSEMKLPAALLGGISVSLQQTAGYSGDGEQSEYICASSVGEAEKRGMES
jgi:hypothetical protein